MEQKFKFKELKVYASTEWLADNKKKYRQVFDRYETTYIYTELSFHNKMFDIDDWEIDVELKCFSLSNDRKELCSLPFQRKVSKADSIVYIREGWGNKKDGVFWKKGAYYWEAWVKDTKLATKYFYIEDALGENISTISDSYLTVESLKLYEGSYEDVLEDEREYLKAFASEETRYIYVEILLKNVNLEKSWQCEIFTKFYNNAYQLKGQVVRLQKVEQEDEFIKITAGWGSNVTGSWRRDKYTAELVFMDRSIATIPFLVGDEFQKSDKLDFKNFTIEEVPEPESDFRILNIPDSLKTGLQQYLLFFRDYVKSAKGKEIKFDVKNVTEGLEIEFGEYGLEEAQLFEEYLNEYLTFAKDNFIGVINVEGNPTSEAIDILRMRLEQQVHNLNMEMKFKDLQMKALENQLGDSQKEKLLLLETVTMAFNQNKKNLLPQYINPSSNNKDLKTTCEKLISEDKIDQVIKILSAFFEDNEYHDKYDSFIITKNRWNNYKKKLHTNQISPESESTEKAKLLSSFLEILKHV